jgi:hypothetical protein
MEICISSSSVLLGRIDLGTLLSVYVVCSHLPIANMAEVYTAMNFSAASVKKWPVEPLKAFMSAHIRVSS